MRTAWCAVVTAVVVASVAAPACAQSGEWVQVESRALLAGGRSADDTKREALYGALAEAVRRVAGVTVQGSALGIRADSGGRVRDQYVEAVRLDAAGHVTEWQVLHEQWRTARDREIGPQVYYEIALRVRVEHNHGMPDAAFTVRLSANGDRFAVRGDVAALNDEIIATVITSMRAWLTVVSIVDDSVFVLAPNAVLMDVASVAGRATEIPDAELRTSGLHFRASLPAGTTRRTELLAVVATKRHVLLMAGSGKGDARDTGVLALSEFNAWLQDIPMDDRAVAQLVLEVRRP